MISDDDFTLEQAEMLLHLAADTPPDKELVDAVIASAILASPFEDGVVKSDVALATGMKYAIGILLALLALVAAFKLLAEPTPLQPPVPQPSASRPPTYPNVEIALVDAHERTWHAETYLAPNASYLIVPKPGAEWNVSPEMKVNIHGHGSRTPPTFSSTRFPGLVSGPGTLAAQIRHGTNFSSAETELHVFSMGTDCVAIRTGPQGGSVSFYCMDKSDSYINNSGVCPVQVIRDDGLETPASVSFPIYAKGSYTSWHITSDTRTSCIFNRLGDVDAHTFTCGLTLQLRDGSTLSTLYTIPEFINHPNTPAYPFPRSKVLDIRRVFISEHIDSTPPKVQEALDDLSQQIELGVTVDQLVTPGYNVYVTPVALQNAWRHEFAP